MELAYGVGWMYIQCTDPATGQTGTFLRDEFRERISPMFRDLSELLPWMHENGWKLEEYAGGMFYPWRVAKLL